MILMKPAGSCSDPDTPGFVPGRLMAVRGQALEFVRKILNGRNEIDEAKIQAHWLYASGAGDAPFPVPRHHAHSLCGRHPQYHLRPDCVLDGCQALKRLGDLVCQRYQHYGYCDRL